MGPIDCPETSVKDYHHTLRNIPEGRRSELDGNFETPQKTFQLGIAGSAEIKKRILVANKSFYGLERQFRSQCLSIKNKVKLNKTLIRPVLAYGSETWVLSKSDEAILGVFERKILRAIYGPTNDNGG
jgi:hypothetical protein